MSEQSNVAKQEARNVSNMKQLQSVVRHKMRTPAKGKTGADVSTSNSNRPADMFYETVLAAKTGPAGAGSVTPTSKTAGNGGKCQRFFFCSHFLLRCAIGELQL